MQRSSKGRFPRFYYLLRRGLLLYLLSISGVGSAQDTGTAGTPWSGEAGKAESVKDIMTREHSQGPKAPQQRIPPRGRIPRKQINNPEQPKGSHLGASGIAFPEVKSASVLSPITADSPVVSNLQTALQTAGTNFLGPTYADSGFVPPSAMGAVGPTQLLVGINGRIRTYNKDGTADGALDTTMDNFFNSVCNCGPPSSVYTTDPRVVFDVLSQRWFVSMINVPSFSISNVQNSGGLFKITTSAPHGLPLGYSGPVSISGASGTGSITAITASGTASGSGSQTAVSQDSTSGTGTGAKFNVSRSGGVYTVSTNAAGSGYAVGDTVTILGNHLGGAAPANNLTITVAAINPIGSFTALNGWWGVTVVDSTNFTLSGSTYSPGWGTGGLVKTANRIMIAVSNGSTITSAGSFAFFQFQQDLVGPTGNPDMGLFADFPTLGIDANAVYVGTNMFDDFANAATYEGVTAFVIKKADLLAGKLTVTPFRHQLGGSTGQGMFSPIAPTNTDPNATTGYFVGNNAFDEITLFVRPVKFNSGTGTFSLLSFNGGNFPVTISTANNLGIPAQGSSPLPLDAMALRLMNAQLVNGSIWTTQGTQVDATGTASSNGGRNGVRFYEITNLSGMPSIRQSGTLFDSAASNPLSYWVGTIGTSGQGHTVLASSYAGPTAYAGVAFAGRLSTDPLGALSSPVVLATGNGAYNVQTSSASGIQRWGDYTNVVVDASDNMTMWAFQQYTNATNSWGVRVSQIKAPPPATPSTAAPLSAPAGTTVSVTITGVSTSGSGFYDPGSTFPNHLSASIDGGGVTVNSVTYTDPTHITLNVTIGAGALQTARTVTVTNPDLQTVTSASAIFQITAPVITLSPSTATLPTGTAQVPYTQSITASGGTAPYTFSVSPGILPSGLSLNGTTGVISGTPTISGSETFTVQATDAFGAKGSTQYTLSISSVITNSFSLVLNSRNYDPTPSAGYVGKFTLNTTLTNTSGLPITSPIYLKLTGLAKNGTDQAPTQLDKLLSATNGAGVAGDIQNVIASLAAGQSTPLTLLVGIGSRQSFSMFFDLYTILPGVASTAVDGVKFNTAARFSLIGGSPAPADDTALPAGVPVLLGQFQLRIADTIPGAPGGDSDFNSDPLSNMVVIGGPGPQSRPAIAVDPLLPTHIAVAGNDYAAQTVRVGTSQDGGLTWHETTLGRSVLNQNFGNAGNPALAFDSHGRLSVVYTLANQFDSSNAVVISESSDGINFSPPSAITFHGASDGVIDSRPAVAIRSGAGRYVAWDSLSTTTLRYSINLVRSAEGGPFGPVTTVASNGLVSSPALALSENVVYVGWDDWGFNSNPPYSAGGRLMITSAPHAARLTFDAPQEIARTAIGFAQKIAAMPEKGVGPNLHLAADPKRDDVVYAVFADKGNGMDIFFARSKNRGRKWDPKTVNNDASAADQFSPAIAVDGDGEISISFYDTRLSTTFETTHIFIARSADGNSFANERLTTASSNDSATNPLRDFTANLGEQTAIAATNNDALVAWTDTRLDTEDIFASVVFDPNGAFVTGTGKISSPIGAYGANPTLAGTAEFGFDFKYKRGSSTPAGDTEFKLAVAKSNIKFKFQSTSYDWLNIAGPMAQFKGSGTVNGAGDYSFLVTITDGNQPGGGGADKFRIKIVDKTTGAVVYDNLPAAPDRIDMAAPISSGKIQIGNK